MLRSLLIQYNVFMHTEYEVISNNMKDKILDFINKSTSKKKATCIIKQNTEFVEYLNSCFPSISSIPEQLRFLRAGFISTPDCLNCGSPVNFSHTKTCSRNCRDEYSKKTGATKKRLQKAKQTMLKKYGVENPQQSAEFVKKRLDTMIELHGSKVSELTRNAAKQRASEFNRKAKLTLKEKYNVDNPSQILGHKEKCEQTLLENYGVQNYFRSEEFKNKSIVRQLELYNIMCEDIIVNSLLTNESKQKLYENPNKIVNFRCTNCDKEYNIPTETFKYRIKNFKTPCPKCANIKHSSAEQFELEEFIRSLQFGIDVNNRTIIAPLEIDIVIPSENLGIEYTGLFWHNDTRIHKNYHKNKLEKCNAVGLELITIFQDEWIYKKDIVKSMLRGKLGISNEKLHASKCTVQEIDSEIANEFLNKNHIQGDDKSNICYGAFYENKLVSVMTFTKTNTESFLEYRMNRFCRAKDTTITGITSKLFNFFVKNTNPDSVIAYADKRWGSVDMFHEKIGFLKLEDTPVNYWHFKGNLRKNNDQNLTEHENRSDQGWLRIWDCGDSKYVWRKK